MALELSEWIDKTKEFHFNVGKLKEMKEGDQVLFLCLDRNVNDLYSHNMGKDPMKPNEFFLTKAGFVKGYQARISVSGEPNSRYMLTFMFDNMNREQINDSVQPLHVEYETGKWYPLNDAGLLGHSFEDRTPPLHMWDKPWDSFPNETRLGWRGPMINMRDISQLPDVYFPSTKELKETELCEKCRINHSMHDLYHELKPLLLKPIDVRRNFGPKEVDEKETKVKPFDHPNVRADIDTCLAFMLDKKMILPDYKVTTSDDKGRVSLRLTLVENFEVVNQPYIKMIFPANTPFAVSRTTVQNVDAVIFFSDEGKTVLPVFLFVNPIWKTLLDYLQIANHVVDAKRSNPHLADIPLVAPVA